MHEMDGVFNTPVVDDIGERQYTQQKHKKHTGPELPLHQLLYPWVQSLANVPNCHIIDSYIITNEPTELKKYIQ